MVVVHDFSLFTFMFTNLGHQGRVHMEARSGRYGNGEEGIPICSVCVFSCVFILFVCLFVLFSFLFSFIMNFSYVIHRGGERALKLGHISPLGVWT